MKITFNGAAQTVTGSQYLVEVNGRKILLECGLFQGRRDDTYRQNLTFRFPLRDLDAVVLSHAHIDHSGNLPNLIKNGYEKFIFATPATAELTDLMVRDSGHIQEADVAFVNNKRQRRGLPPVEPLYTLADAEHVKNHLRPKEYGQEFEPIPGVRVHFVDAGHILGSAGVVLDVQEKGRSFRFWFSGDIGRPNLPLLRDPVLPENADYLMMESTYGDKPHRDPAQAYEEFRQVVMRTAQRGGKVIIPAFSVGRTQEIVFSLNEMISHGDLPRLPVFVDSPLAVNASEIFSQFAPLFDAETQQFIREQRHPALEFPGLTYVRSVDESKRINDLQGPLVIISASGMAETGRILHHLRNNIENPRNTVMIVSWQAPDTLGRRLAEQQPWVNIFGERYTRRAEVATIGGLSAHAGQDVLLRYAQASRASLKKIILIHGEPDAAGALTEKLKEAGAPPIDYPALGDEITLE